MGQGVHVFVDDDEVDNFRPVRHELQDFVSMSQVIQVLLVASRQDCFGVVLPGQ